MRTALGIAYDGTDFAGWQAQSGDVLTVQGVLEKALSKVIGSPVETFCSGRTDAGVHACLQVAHFEHLTEMPEQAWVRGCNDFLPHSVRILWGRPVPEDFHARFSSLSRVYRYVLLQQAGPSALENRYTAWDFHPLNLEKMQKAAALLLGTHNFSAFRSVRCQSHDPVRTLLALKIEQQGNRFVFDIEASGFLHNMVRILVGSLASVGRGEHPPVWIQEVLESKKRVLAGVTFPPSGLFFCGARYEDRFGLQCLTPFSHR